MTQFLLDTINLDLTNNYEHRFQNGRFSILNSTHVHASYQHGKYATSLKSMDSFQFAGQRKELRWLEDHSDYSGINRKFITAEGLFDTSLALSEFSRATTEKRLVKEDTLAILKMQTQTDSHEQFLYNMLLSWHRAGLYAHQSEKDMVLRVKTQAYVDSHAVVYNDREDTEHTYSIALEAPVPAEMVLGDGWQFRASTNHWMSPYVVKYPAVNKKQEYFYLAHLSGRSNASVLNGEFNFQGINRASVLLEPISGVPAIFEGEPDIDWGNPELLWLWIVDYVRLNRLEQQFAAAFEALTTMVARPIAYTMEATVWNEVPMTLTLPVFSPTRAKIAIALEGEPFIPDAAPHEFLMNDGRAPKQALLLGALTNYYMWLGAYAILDNESKQWTDWHFGLSCQGESTEILDSFMSKAASVSAITGREYSTLMTVGCNARPRYSKLTEVDAVYVASSPDGTVPPVVKLTGLPSPVSGAIVNGTVVGHYPVLAHLTGVQVINPRNARNVEGCYDTVLKLANLYREFGHDTEWCNMVGGATVRPYGAAHQAIIDPYSLHYSEKVDFLITPIRSIEREGRSSSLPTLQQTMLEETVTVFKLRPSLTMCEWGQRTRTLPPVAFTKQKKVVNVFKIRAGGTSIKTKLTATRRDITKKDFQGAEQVIAPSIPVLNMGVDLPVADTIATTNDV